MSVDQICWNAFCASRFFSTICTGFFGHGKRSDSWNVAGRSFASGVVSHSPYTDAKPREKIELIRVAVDDLEEVLAEVRGVDQVAHAILLRTCVLRQHRDDAVNAARRTGRKTARAHQRHALAGGEFCARHTWSFADSERVRDAMRGDAPL